MPLDDRSKPLYQPWRQEEFRADLRVSRLTPVQRWMYRTLLQEAFVCSTRPYLPDDDEELWLLADCESPEQWQANRDAVLRMFESFDIDGIKLLGHKRLIDDWERLIEKRGEMSETNSRNAKEGWKKRKTAKSCDAMRPACDPHPSASDGMRTDAKTCQVSKQVKASQSEEKEEAPPPSGEEPQNDGQEIPMAIRDQIENICENEIGAKPERSADWGRMNKLVGKHNGVHVVAGLFREWGGTLSSPPSNPVTTFLRWYDGLPAEQVRQIGATPKAVDDMKRINREIAVISGGKVALDRRQKLDLETLMSEESYSVEEVLSAFRGFFAGLNPDDTVEMRYAPKNFVEKADGLIFAARKKQADKERDAALLEEAKDKMQAERQAELSAELAALDAEEKAEDEAWL